MSSIIPVITALAGLITAITAFIHSIRTRAYCDANTARVRKLPDLPVDKGGTISENSGSGFHPREKP